MPLDAAAVATAYGWDPARLTALTLERLEKLATASTEDGGFCPACALSHNSYHVVVGVPLDEAVSSRIVDVSLNPHWSSLDRDHTLFVFCPYCTWWGIPSEAEVIRLRNHRSEFRRESR